MRHDFYVYRYTCPIRDEVIYIGKGKDGRCYSHLRRKDKHPLTHRIQWMRKQGVEPIIDFICKDQDEEFAYLVEAEAIAKYGRKDLGKGTLLNLSDGGEGATGITPHNKGKSLSPEQCAKLSATCMGRKLSDETKRKMVLKMTGSKRSQETKAKMSASQTGKKMSLEARQKMSAAWVGRVISPETRARMSAAHKARNERIRAERSGSAQLTTPDA